MEGFSDKINLSSDSTNKDETSIPSDDNGFVGLNAENWKKMHEINPLYQYICKNNSYLNIQTGNHQETIHELDWRGHNWHNKVPETLLKSVTTEIMDEMEKLRNCVKAAIDLDILQA